MMFLLLIKFNSIFVAFIVLLLSYNNKNILEAQVYFRPKSYDTNVISSRYLIANSIGGQLRPNSRLLNSRMPSPQNSQKLKKQESLTCGFIKPKLTHYISNGQKTDHALWPWNVQLVINTNNYTFAKTFCGGTIVSNSYLITAAHCFDEIEESKRPYNTIIYFNAINLNTQKKLQKLNSMNKGTTSLKLRAKEVIINPKYVPNIGEFETRLFENIMSGPRHDLALVRFDINDGSISQKLVDLANSQLKRICLPPADSHLSPGSKCKILGQGFMNADDEDEYIMQEDLHSADVIISTNERCKSQFESQRIKSKMNADTLCINGATHPCVGDSGGPLVCHGSTGINDYGTKRWYLMGVTSFAVSTNTKDKCGLFKSAVFAKIANYIDWIEQYTKNDV